MYNIEVPMSVWDKVELYLGNNAVEFESYNNLDSVVVSVDSSTDRDIIETIVVNNQF